MKNQMLLTVISAIVLGMVLGFAAGPTSEIFGVRYVQLFDLIGNLFLNSLTLVVIPLVSASVIIGTAKMGKDLTFGNLGLKTFGFFLLTSSMAVLTAAVLSVILQPGVVPDRQLILSSFANTEAAGDFVTQMDVGAFDKFQEIVLKIVPSNILAAASQGQMLGLLGFCLLVGYFIPKIESGPGEVLLQFWKGIFQIMMSMTHLIIKMLPIGVFCLVAKAVAITGYTSIIGLASFAMVVLASLAIFTLILLPVLLWLIGRMNPLEHLKVIFPALVTAFSTSSSAASLPVLFECMEKRAMLPNRICGFTLPLGSTLNLAGSSSFVCVSVFFVAQLYGLPITLPLAMGIASLTLLASLGMAGIPSGSLITVLIVLKLLGLPSGAMGLILAVDRILDMFRTAANVYSNTCCAVLVHRTEKGSLGTRVLEEPL